MKRLPIVLTCDNNYAKYASVVISSLIINRNKNTQYEINILSEDITEENKQAISRQVAEVSSFEVKFHQLKNIDTTRFYLNSYMSASTYYRFFIPEIFPEHERILHLDCDLIVDADISLFADMHFDDKIAICCSSPYMISKIKNDDDPEIPASYFSEVLKMPNPLEYFNAGVVLYNLQMMREKNIQQKLFNALQEIPKPKFQDQDILNAVFSRNGGVKLIDQKFNNTRSIKLTPNRLLFNSLCAKLKLNLSEPWFYIYHYVGKIKPWQEDKRDSGLFFQYAYKTPFFEEIIKVNGLDKNKITAKYRLPLF